MDKEQLSALLDGELDELGTARLMRALQSESQGLETWEEYGLIGDALRERDGLSVAGSAGARRALAQIMTEPAPEMSGMQSVLLRLRALRPAIPWAVAASAAVVVFLFAGGRPPGSDPSVASNAPSDTRVAGTRLDPAGDTVTPVSDDMARYVDFHREVAAPGFERASLVTDGGGSERAR
jgi:negative regulator of sigma E activity